MGKSSIHIRPVKMGSESHNQRLKSLPYVRNELSTLNTGFQLETIKEAQTRTEQTCKEKTGRRMQAKATPIREGVLLIKHYHTLEDLQRVAKAIEKRFGIRSIQGYCHKDEGHWDKTTGEWKPNYHAHLIFDWTNLETGKSIKLNRDDMAEFQDIVAESLGLERGISSSTRHLNAVQFKVDQEVKTLEELKGKQKTLEIALRDVDDYKVKGFLVHNHEKTVAGLKTALKSEIIKNEEVVKLKRQVTDLNKLLANVGSREELNLKILSKRAQQYLESPNKANEMELKDMLSSTTKDKSLSERYRQEYRQYQFNSSIDKEEQKPRQGRKF